MTPSIQTLINDSSLEDIEWILCDALDLKRSQLQARSLYVLTEEEWMRVSAYMERRSKGEPLAYIHGSVSFYDCLISVNPAVLIPRPETELLVERVVQELKQINCKNRTLVDLCCGSGCIGIALKKLLPELNVLAVDNSQEVLDCAKHNARENAVDLQFLKSDLLKDFEGKADFIVCNPPYISTAEYLVLDAEVRNFEPRQALEAGDTGLELYQRLAEELPDSLVLGGHLWMEIGGTQGDDMKEIFNQGAWEQLLVAQDYAGWDRFVSLRRTKVLFT